MNFFRSCDFKSNRTGPQQTLRNPFQDVIQQTLFVIAIYFFANASAYAERYSVERDSFGNYSAKKVEAAPENTKEELSEVEQEKQKVSDKDVIDANPTPVNGQLDSVSPSSSVDPLIVNQNTQAESSVNEASKSSSGSEATSSEDVEPRKLSIFEQKYLEAELAERKRILNAIKSTEGAAADYDATEVNPEDFVDSDVHLRSADKQVKERSPYYVTVDVDGRPQTTFYDPTLVREILFTERNKKIEYTDAQVYQEKDKEIAIPESADPVALSILSGGKDRFASYFETFTEKCCDDLPNIQTPEISVGKYHYFVLNDDSLPYRFAEGDSRFLLLRLPDLDQAEIPIRIRTFIRKFASQNIEKGVFFPQIVTLDKNKQPLRIITGPLLKYQEETWTTHAYLQGIFALSQTRELDERYLLINTTRDTLASSSSMDIPGKEKDSARTVTLQHMNEGSFEIEILL